MHIFYALPTITDQTFIKMHLSFIWRRLIIFGLLPALVATIIFWQLIQLYVLYFLFLPLFVFIVAICIKKKFRIWALDDVLFIKKGIFGEEKLMMQWHKLQSVDIKQSIFQRRKFLANLVINTAGGNIHISYISIKAAKELADFILYKTESNNKNWM